jgi:hypothetical protein
MINQTLHTIKGLCNGLSTGLFILTICLQLIPSLEPYRHYWVICCVIGWAILISGWCINDKME